MSMHQSVDRYLSSQRFLRSANDDDLRERDDFCTGCHGRKTHGYPLCPSCDKHRRCAAAKQWKLADRTAFICYGEAKGKDQLGSDMYSYKDEQVPAVDAQKRLAALLYHTLYHYWEAANTPPITCITTIPSLRDSSRNRLAKLTDTVVSKLPIPINVGSVLSAKSLRGDAKRQRILDPGLFVCSDALRGHVLVVEDSWVTGSHAQSAAVALRDAGAEYVTVLSIARLVYEDVLAEFQPPSFNVGHHPEQSPFYS